MEDKEKPPKPTEKPNYKCIKVNLNDILAEDKNLSKHVYDIINTNVIRVSKITSKTYLLLRKWVLNHYHLKDNFNEIEIPFINQDVIRMCTLSFLKQGRGPNPKIENQVLLDEFRGLHDFKEIDGEHIKKPLEYYYTTMLTSIENNIKNNFINYINRFVNSYFKKMNETELNNKKFKDKLMSELKVVKDDILNNTLFCDPKYHEWLTIHRFKIVPENPDVSYYYEIKSNPQKYLKHMIYMNIELEKINAKLYQFFPLQSSCIPIHIQIDSNVLIDFLVDSFIYNDTVIKAKDMRNDIKKYQEELWKKYFNIKHTLKGYNFNYTIITDGYSVSIRFIENNFNILNDIKKSYLAKGRKETTGVSAEEQTKNANKKKDDKMKVEEEKKEERKKDDSNEKEHKNKVKTLNKYKKSLEKNKIEISKISSKNNKKKIKIEDDIKELEKNILTLEEELKMFNIKEVVFKEKNVEFPYIDEVNKKDLKGRHIFIDPGKRSLLTMMNDKGKFLSYTNKKWLYQTSRLKYQKRLENYKKDHDNNETDENKRIIKNEELLSDLNSKTCDYNKFKDYIKTKLKVNRKVHSFYEDSKFRRYKWYGFINRKRALDKMLNLIEETYDKYRDKNIKIIIGDWSIGKSMRNFISTPNISIKRKLKERFKHVYNIDEFRTSCLSYKTGKKCEHLHLNLPDKKDPIKKTLQKMHAILTYKMENNRLACINRDKNGCKNIQKIFNFFIKTGERPYNYRRDVKIDLI